MDLKEAIKQLESLKRDRESFLIQEQEHDEIFLKDIQAIDVATEELKKLEAINVENKTADDMFFELDFDKENLYTVDGNFIAESFREGLEKRITFNLLEKSICTYGNITMQKLKAINKKVEEYGWNE